MHKPPLPKGFLLGVSTAAYQVEGGIKNNRSEFGKKQNIPHTVKHFFIECKMLLPKKIFRIFKKHFEASDLMQDIQNPNTYHCGKSCDHYHRYEEDFDLIQNLGCNAYRFSLEWARIQPTEGVFDQKAIDYYIHYVDELLKRGITPMITLWHYTLPLWVDQQGGWGNKKTLKDFLNFVEHIIPFFQKKVHFWVTLNEPEIFTLHAYFTGIHPPQKRNIFLALKVYWRLVKAHKKAYTLIKRKDAHAQIGIAKNQIDFQAYKNLWYNRLVAWISNHFWNNHFFNQINAYQDYIGINHYFRRVIHLGSEYQTLAPLSDIATELVPEAILAVIEQARKYKKPIYITENGLADKHDEYRSWYLNEILQNIQQARSTGLDVRGYFHWSLLDNFEWEKGFWARFGLVEVNFTTLKRIPRPSYFTYRKLIKKYS